MSACTVFDQCDYIAFFFFTDIKKIYFISTTTVRRVILHVQYLKQYLVFRKVAVRQNNLRLAPDLKVYHCNI